MELIRYVKFTKPGEKEALFNLMKTTPSNQLRAKVAETFNLSTIDAAIVIKRFEKQN